MDPDAHAAKVRLGVVAGVVALVVAVTVALLVGVASRGGSSGPGTGAAPSTQPVRSKPTQTTGSSPFAGRVDLHTVYAMPAADDPVAFARAYIRALLTYDTTRQTLATRRAALMAWTPPDGFFSDAESMLDDFLGGEDTWEAAQRVHQSETVVIDRVWIPESQKRLMAREPAKVAAAHWPYVVTARVVREVRGDVGTNTDEPLTLSVIVSCPPHRDCVALAPGRSAVTS